ncbi:hypothetical protein EU537_09340 [Candidatus Thorarchaeota archaeon]|nr:MAG: hypothetical protein EU537_09340 [Candidatus Thorarchaeota archaeon]
MVDKNQFSVSVREIRDSLDYERGVAPLISKVIETEDRLHVLVPDRAEKSLLLGPGGRVVAKLSEVFGTPITVHSNCELLLRERQLRLTFQRIGKLLSDSSPNQKPILQQLRLDIEKEMEYPRRQIDMRKEDTGTIVAVAFSGGVDSGAALYWATRQTRSVISLTADLGCQVMGNPEKRAIRYISENLEISQYFIDASSNLEKIFEGAIKEKLHPCGRCHRTLMESIRNSARDLGVDLLLTGELLPTGRQSIELMDDLMIIHLPATLSLSKYRTRKISSCLGMKHKQERFGCRLLSRCHQKGWKMIGPSIYRVLRETEAGILSTGQSLQQIKNILGPSLECLKKRNRAKNDC